MARHHKPLDSGSRGGDLIRENGSRLIPNSRVVRVAGGAGLIANWGVTAVAAVRGTCAITSAWWMDNRAGQLATSLARCGDFRAGL